MPRPRGRATLTVLKGGNTDRRRPRLAGERITSPPPPPKHLGDRASAEWRTLARSTTQLGTLTGADLRGLELLAETLATEAELRAVLAVEGMTVEGAGGGMKAHPGMAALDRCRGQAHRLLESFGLTPKARNYIEAVRPAITDPSEEFFSS